MQAIHMKKTTKNPEFKLFCMEDWTKILANVQVWCYWKHLLQLSLLWKQMLFMYFCHSDRYSIESFSSINNCLSKNIKSLSGFSLSIITTLWHLLWTSDSVSGHIHAENAKSLTSTTMTSKGGYFMDQKLGKL